MDVRRAVHTRMTDPNAQVREATIDLLGKFLMNKPDLIEDYYPIFIERIKVSQNFHDYLQPLRKGPIWVDNWLEKP